MSESVLIRQLQALVRPCVGDPNGQLVGSPGMLALNSQGGAGATLWVKESGSGTNTGWIPK